MSHHFPVAALVVLTVVAVVVVCVGLDVDVVVDVVVGFVLVPHDANARDNTIRQLTTSHRILFLILFFLSPPGFENKALLIF